MSKFTTTYSELPVGILDTIQNIYGNTRTEEQIITIIDDYRLLRVIESCWSEPELSLKALIK